ncbi:hypothetical protein C3F09_02070 [candidate division GN15 bacterium]|uniref:TIGR03016 family PEP-CTERM system-associated outer membrane protein n=1 Tax=candidate division GN15 bacterium TaxID=2072418 RepID=A0A855X3V5_9BACT|nr:MAG: hypothetical protein C3F09_02070 [candidate division GN15 bacterium]
MILPRGIAGVTGVVVAIVLLPWLSRAGQLSGTINATYQRSTREAVLDTIDSLVSPESSIESKQSNILLNYQDVLFTKNLMRLGLNYYIQRDELADRWNVRPIYYLDLGSAGYQYSGSYSPRKVVSTLPINDSTSIETRTYIRDWRNSLTLSYSRLPVVSLTYNTTRYFDDQAVRTTDRKNRYLTAQSSYTVGPASANVIYTNSRAENRLTSPRTKDKYRTLQTTTGFAGSSPKIGSFSASYSYLDSRSTREGLTPGPVSTSHIHSVAAMVTSRQVLDLSATASYSGRFNVARSAEIGTTTSDQNFSGQVAYTPLDFLSLSMTKNYQILSQAGSNRISENLALSTSFTRFLRRGFDTRLNWTRTYIQKAQGIDETQVADSSGIAAPGGSNYTDAFYTSVAATPYRRSKLLADMSIIRASRPWLRSQRYQSSRSVSVSAAVTRNIDGRVTATYVNQGASLDLFHSFARSVTAGATYMSGSNLNCNVAYTRNDVNTFPRVSNRVVSGYVGYSYRTAYTIYVYMNRQQEEHPSPGSTIESAVSKPRSLTAQLQLRLSLRSLLAVSYTKSSNAAASAGVAGTHILQVVYHGQF